MGSLGPHLLGHCNLSGSVFLLLLQLHVQGHCDGVTIPVVAPEVPLVVHVPSADEKLELLHPDGGILKVNGIRGETFGFDEVGPECIEPSLLRDVWMGSNRGQSEQGSEGRLGYGFSEITYLCTFRQQPWRQRTVSREEALGW